MNTPPLKKSYADKEHPYYTAWLKTLHNAADYHGSITDIAVYIANKNGKEMKNIRPIISKIMKSQRMCSSEYLLIIQEWMNTKT